MRLKIGKKLKTASHNSKFTNSYQKRVNTLYTYYFIVDCSRVARISQRGGGFFGSLLQPKTNLTQIFISFKLDWGGFSVKIRWSPKKKKTKVFTEIQRVFPAEIKHATVFFRPNTGDLQKKEKVFTEIQRVFRPKSEIQMVFIAEIRWSPKKKGLHRLWVSSKTKKLHYFGPNNGKFFTTSAPKSLWEVGAVFIFRAKIGLKSTKNVLFCILFSTMGGSSLSRLPWLRYWSIVDNSDILTHSIYFVFLSTANKPTTLKLANFVCSWCIGLS